MEKKKLKWIQIIVPAALTVIAVSVAAFLIPLLFPFDTDDLVKEDIIGKEGKVTMITESTLEKVIRKNRLYTVEYPYNGYAAIYDENDNIKYYVAYEGYVKAGIDVTQITLSMDENTATIIMRLPKVQIEKPIVNAGTMEYIFRKEKYHTETVAQEAYRYAEQDLAEKVRKDSDLEACATEAAKAAGRALIEPWLNQVETEKAYTVRVLGYGEVE